MIKKILKFKIVLVSILLITFSCSKDDDQPSSVNLENLEVSMDENPSNGETIGTVETSGGTAINLSITSQSPSGALDIDSSSGELIVANATLFDFETNPMITATVTADNAENSASITINLNNVSEVSAQSLEVTIDENPTDGEVIGTLQTMGNASGFTITSQSPDGAMAINASTGELTVADATLFDFETNPAITATVSIEDALNPVSVTINLENVFEVTVQDFTISIDENPTDGDVLGSVLASGNGTPSFSIDAQTPAGALNINQATGELTVADATLFDFETNPIITATISVADGINTATATINLNDIQELTIQDLTVSIDENPTDGQVVGTMQTNGSGTLDFSITSQTPTGALAIASTGELTVVDPNLFDFETNPVITAAISVTDGSETATATATVNLNDLDEVSATNTNLTIDENSSNGDVVGTLQASGSNLTYTITFQNPAGAFNINQSTGELSVADESLFDFETTPNMLATISVDNGTQSVSANAFVALNDLNEIGEFKYGGIIFWIDPASNNSEGLVVSLNYQATGVPWGCTGITTGATGTAIGTGETNTTAIIAAGCNPGSAAEIVSNLSSNGYDDWFLPSVDEFFEIFQNINIVGNAITNNGGDTLTNANWSSTEDNSNNAFWPNINSSITVLKSSTFLNVRAVRAWTDF